MPRDWRARYIRQYHSTHYTRFMPRTREEWQYTLRRIDANYGDIFATLSKDSAVLDIPCGVGYLEEYLVNRGFLEIHAVDLSEEQVAMAKHTLAAHDVSFDGKVRFEVADAFEYLRRGSGFQLIAAIDFLDHLPKGEIVTFLSLARDALAEDGLLLVRVTNADNPIFGSFFYRDFTHETPFTPASMRQCLEGAGFRALRIGYEKPPKTPVGAFHPGWSMVVVQKVRRVGLGVLGRLMGLPANACAEDLVAVASK
jgi:SAM-dependent methyltransferase